MVDVVVVVVDTMGILVVEIEIMKEIEGVVERGNIAIEIGNEEIVVVTEIGIKTGAAGEIEIEENIENV
jgi:hypothetical protein